MSENKTVMISLVGEQPAPNVLPLRHYRPDQVVLVHTSLTAGLAERIAGVIGGEFDVLRPFCKTEAFLVDQIRAELTNYINRHLPNTDLIFNLTGGTKTMEYAALEVARQMRAKAFYYQTEGNQSLIHPYHFTDAGEMTCETPLQAETTLNIDEFLSLYVREYKPAEQSDNAGKEFERKILEVLQMLGPGYEILPNQRLSGFSDDVEVDWILRYQNTFAVGEVKLKASKSSGIDQLNAATDQRMLGTYTKKFLVTARKLHYNSIHLAEASRITTIILPSGSQVELSNEDKAYLVQIIRSSMEPRKPLK
jgi:hypothetical protein